MIFKKVAATTQTKCHGRASSMINALLYVKIIPLHVETAEENTIE